jgi:peptidoglycan/LPS O-acetylase OafA/YrhL
MVIASHSYPLSYGTSEREPMVRLTLGQDTLGGIAVNLFFLISGMLITASWLRSRSMQDFLYKRVLRIYPGFIVAILFCAALVWSIFPQFRHSVDPRQWAWKLSNDIVFLTTYSTMDSRAFSAEPLPGAINGSLWTISREFTCYLLVALLGMFCLFKRRKLILAIALGVWLFYVLELFFGHHGDAQLAARFYVYFLAGMIFWLFRDKIRFSLPVALASGAALILASRLTPFWNALFPLAGCYVALWVALRPGWRFTRWTENTDLSYGIYLYAFPVQQVVAMFPPLRHAATNFLVTLPITMALAWLSWHFIEQRFLQLKSHRMTDFDPALRAST